MKSKKIADNIARVTKNGGLVSIGVKYSTTEAINSAKKIKNLFKGSIEKVFFKYDADLKNKPLSYLKKHVLSGSSQILLQFSIKKQVIRY